MGIFTRYLLIEYFKVFLVTLFSLTVLLIVFLLAREAMDQGLGLPQVVRLIPYVIPNALLFTVPGTTLFAASVLYGRMSGMNEVVAIKSLGIDPWVIVVPLLFVGVGLSLATVVLNDLAWSWGYHGVQRVVLEAGEEIAYSMLRTQKSYSSKRFSIIVRDVEGRWLIGAAITLHGGSEGRTVTITADEAELKSDLSNDVLRILCRGARIDVDGKVGIDARNELIEQEISLKDFRQREASNSPSRLTLAQLRRANEEQHVRYEQMKKALAVKAASQMLSFDFEGLTGEEWAGEAYLMRDLQGYLNRVKTEPYRRWANGFSCLCFLLVGIPVAIWRRNSDFISSFFICFLPILIVYYPLLMFGVDRAKNGALHPAVVWLGNLVLAAAGIWLMRRVRRY
jgi:lipopolysaccharide export system permease protein